MQKGKKRQRRKIILDISHTFLPVACTCQISQQISAVTDI